MDFRGLTAAFKSLYDPQFWAATDILKVLLGSGRPSSVLKLWSHRGVNYRTIYDQAVNGSLVTRREPMVETVQYILFSRRISKV